MVIKTVIFTHDAKYKLMKMVYFQISMLHIMLNKETGGLQITEATDIFIQQFFKLKLLAYSINVWKIKQNNLKLITRISIGQNASAKSFILSIRTKQVILG